VFEGVWLDRIDEGKREVRGTL